MDFQDFIKSPLFLPTLLAWLDDMTYADLKSRMSEDFKFEVGIVNMLNPDGGFLRHMSYELARKIITDNSPVQLGQLGGRQFFLLRDYFTVAQLDSIVPGAGPDPNHPLAYSLTYPVTIDNKAYNSPHELATYLDTTTYAAVKDKLPAGFIFEMEMVNLLQTGGQGGFLNSLDIKGAQGVFNDNTSYQLGIMSKGVFDIIGDFLYPGWEAYIPAAKLAALLFPLKIDSTLYNTAQDFATYLETTSYADVKGLLPKRFRFVPELVNLLKTDGTGFLGHMSNELAQRIITDNNPAQLGRLDGHLFFLLKDYFTVAQFDSIVPDFGLCFALPYPVTIDNKAYNSPHELATYLDTTTYVAVKDKLPAGFIFEMEMVNLLKTDGTGFLANMTNELAQRIIRDNSSYQLGIMSKGIFDIIGEFFDATWEGYIPAAKLAALLFPLKIGSTLYNTAQDFATYLETTTYADIKGLLPKRFRFVPELVNLLRPDGTGFLGHMTDELARRIITDNSPVQQGQMKIAVFNLLEDFFTLPELNSIVPTTSIANFINYPVTIGGKICNGPHELATYLDTTTYAAVKDKLPAGFTFEMALVNLLQTRGPGSRSARSLTSGSQTNGAGFLDNMDQELAQKIITSNTTYEWGIMNDEVYAIMEPFFTPEQFSHIPAARRRRGITPITIGGETYSTLKDIADYLDTTTYAAVKPILPPGFKFSIELVNLLKADGTGFLKEATNELVQQIIADNTQAELDKIDINRFQMLQDASTPDLFNRFGKTAITNLLNFDLPKFKWGATIAKWLPTELLPAILAKTPDIPDGKGFFANLSYDAVAYINADYFKDFPIKVYTSLCSLRIKTGAGPSWEVPRQDHNTLGDLANIQWQKMPDSIINELIRIAISQPVTFSKAYPCKLEFPDGFLSRLAPKQVLKINDDNLAKLQSRYFKGMTVAQQVALLTDIKKKQVKALTNDVLENGFGPEAAQTLPSDVLLKFLQKVPEEKQYLLPDEFLINTPGISANDVAKLNNLSANDLKSPPRAIRNILNSLSRNDAAQFGPTSAFYAKINTPGSQIIKHISPLFFKNFSQLQVNQLNVDVVPLLDEKQLFALGHKVSFFSETQSKALTIEQLQFIPPDYKMLMEKVPEMIAQLNLIQTGSRRVQSDYVNHLSEFELKSIVRNWWDTFGDTLKAKLLYRIIRHKIPFIDLFKKAQLLALNGDVLSLLIEDTIHLEQLSICLLKIPAYGREVHDTLLETGMYDIAYEHRSQIEGKSSNRFDAQIMIVFGSEPDVDLDPLPYAYKMADTVPSLIYNYDPNTFKARIKNVVNGDIRDELILLRGKSNVRTYLMGHGDIESLRMGGDSTSAQPGGITFYNIYDAVNELWRKLSPDAPGTRTGSGLAKFVKLSILGCSMASPPMQFDDNDRPIAEQSDDWRTYFRKSFLGSISEMFFRQNSLYRSTLEINAYKQPISVARGSARVEIEREVEKVMKGGREVYYIKYEVFSGRKLDKIYAKWDDTQQKVVARSGTDEGVSIYEYTKVENVRGTVNPNFLLTDQDELHEQYLDGEALAILEPERFDIPDRWAGKDTLSIEMAGTNRAIVLLRNPFDGDVRSSASIWEINDPAGTTTKPARLIRAAGINRDNRLAHALEQLQLTRTWESTVSAWVDRMMALPALAGITGAANIEQARKLIANMPEAQDTELIETKGDLGKLRALHAQKVSSLHNLELSANSILASLNTLTPAEASNILLNEGVATSFGAGGPTLDEVKTKAILTGWDTVLKVRVLAALLHLSDVDSTALMARFSNATDPILKQVGSSIVSQRQAMAASKNGQDAKILTGGGAALNAFFTATAIYNLIRNWHASTEEQISLDLTLLIGTNISYVANLVVMKSIQASMKAMVTAGTNMSRSMGVVTKAVPALDFALAGVSMASIGLQWEDFWKSGAGESSYAYKALVANTVTTVVFTAAGLAVTGSYLAVSLGCTLTGLELVAANAGPIGLAIAAGMIVVGGVVQGSLILHEYGAYYDSIGEEVAQFFASWIGLETDATRRAKARKLAAETALALAAAAANYATLLNSRKINTDTFLKQHYFLDGYTKIYTLSPIFTVTPYQKTQAGGFNPPFDQMNVSGRGDFEAGVLNVTSNSSIVNISTGVVDDGNAKGYVFMGLGMGSTSQNYTAIGHAEKPNLFDLRNTSIRQMRCGEGPDQIIINPQTSMWMVADLSHGFKTLIIDAENETVKVLCYQNERQPFCFFPATNARTKYDGFVDHIFINNAGRGSSIDLTHMPKGLLFDVSSSGGYISITGSAAGGNTYIARERNQIQSKGNDMLVWDGSVKARIRLIGNKRNATQMLTICLTSDYRNVGALRAGNDLILAQGNNAIRIRYFYNADGSLDNSKLVSITDPSQNVFTLTALEMLGSTYVSLYKLSKTFAFRKGMGGKETTPKKIWGDDSISTYSFSDDSGYYDISFSIKHLNQIVMEVYPVTDVNRAIYKREGNDLRLTSDSSECNLIIRDYFTELEPNALLKIWIKSTVEAQPQELVIEDEQNMPENTILYFNIQETELPTIAAKKIIDLNTLATDIQLVPRDYKVAKGRGVVSVSIPPEADPARLIQCRSDNDLVLYYADSLYRDGTSLPPKLIIKSAYSSNAVNANVNVYLFQDRYERAESIELLALNAPNYDAQHTMVIGEDQIIRANLRPGEQHYYTFVDPLTIGNLFIEFAVYDGACNMQVQHNQGTDDIGLKGSVYHEDPNVRFISYSNPRGNYMMIVSAAEDRLTEINSYGLMVTTNASTTQTKLDPGPYNLVSNISLLDLIPTRFLGNTPGALTNVSGFDVISSLGKKQRYMIELDFDNRREWLLDNTAVETNNDTLLLTGNCSFSDLEFVTSSPDLGLSLLVVMKDNEPIRKIIWFKDYAFNPVTRGMIIKLNAYDNGNLSFALPVPDPQSGCFVLSPTEDTIAVAGIGYFILDLDHYSDRSAKIFLPYDLLINLDTPILTPNMAPCFCSNAEQIGYDLQISQGGLTLYIRNYYRRPQNIQFYIVGNSSGDRTSSQLAGKKHVVFPDAEKAGITAAYRAAYDYLPVELYLPARIEGLDTSDVNIRKFINFMYKVNDNTTAVSQKTVELYIKMFISIPVIAKDPDVLRTLTLQQREYILMKIMLIRSNKENLGSQHNEFSLEYYNQYLVTDKGWLTKVEDYRYINTLLVEDIDYQLIAPAALYGLTIDQVKPYNEYIKSFILFTYEEFSGYASLITGKKVIFPVDGRNINPHNFDPKPTAPRDQDMLVLAMKAKGYSATRSNTMLAAMGNMDYVPTDLVALDRLLDSREWKTDSDYNLLKRLLQAGVSVWDIQQSNANRTRYESGKRNDLIQVKVSPALGNIAGTTATYELLANANVTVDNTGLRLVPVASGTHDLSAGTLVTPNGWSPAPDQLLASLGRDVPINQDTILLARLYYSNKDNVSLWKTMTTKIMANSSWYGMTSPDNMVNGQAGYGEAYGWRPAGGDDYISLTGHTGGDYIMFTFRDKIQLSNIRLSTNSYTDTGVVVNSSTLPGYIGALYRIEALNNDGTWATVESRTDGTDSYGTRSTMQIDFRTDVIDIPVNTYGIPYIAYRIFFTFGSYVANRWINEVTFTTAAV